MAIDMTEFDDNALPDRLFPIIKELSRVVNDVESLPNAMQTQEGYIEDIDTRLVSAEQGVSNAQTTANNAVQKNGGTLTNGLVSGGNVAPTYLTSDDYYHYRTLTIPYRNTPSPYYHGNYKTTDNLVTLWFNNTSGAEQKIKLPISPFGTTKLNVVNTPTPGTSTGLVSLTNKVKDSGNEFNTTTMRFTATIAGDYDLSATALKVGSAETKLTFRKNGIAFGVGASVPVTTNNEIISLSDLVGLAAGDYIDLYVSAGQIITDFATNSLIVTTRI